MNAKLRMMLIAAVGVGVAAQGAASSRTKLSVDPNTNESRVQFTSDAPLEKITGVGTALKGEVEVDPAAIANTKGKIELEVASLRTNIDLRDEHLRGPDWLDARKYPTIKFEIVSVEGPAALAPDSAVDVKVRGKLTMHGVTREETATAKVRWQPDQGIRLQAQLKVNLTHYNVSVPSLVRLKVSDEIGLNVMLKVRTKDGAKS
jgi:polyisoprenoid-binding protein YceI